LSYGGSGHGGQVSVARPRRVRLGWKLRRHQKVQGIHPIQKNNLSNSYEALQMASCLVNPIPHWLKYQIKRANIMKSLASFAIPYKALLKFS